MAISITLENKTTALSDNFEAKTGALLTFAEATWSFDEDSGTFAQSRRVAAKEDKNAALADNFESKN